MEEEKTSVRPSACDAELMYMALTEAAFLYGRVAGSSVHSERFKNEMKRLNQRCLYMALWFEEHADFDFDKAIAEDK
jgi:hypothetical protein